MKNDNADKIANPRYPADNMRQPYEKAKKNTPIVQRRRCISPLDAKIESKLLPMTVLKTNKNRIEHGHSPIPMKHKARMID